MSYWKLGNKKEAVKYFDQGDKYITIFISEDKKYVKKPMPKSEGNLRFLMNT